MFKGIGYQFELRRRARRQAALDKLVAASIDQVLHSVAGRTPPIKKHLFWGASATHPRHLLVAYIFESDADLLTAESNGLSADLDTFTRRELVRSDYPDEGIPLVHVTFASNEDMLRKAGGNAYVYFNS